VTEGFASPPSASGTPGAPPPPRSDFRPAPLPPRKRAPKWLWWLIIVSVAVIVAGSAWAIALERQAANLEPASAGVTGRLHSAQVVSGMCMESLGDAAGVVQVVPCDEPHRAEAVTAYTFTNDEWPGDSEAEREALDYCASQLAADGPLATASAGRDWVAWVPSEATWEAGDRTALCIVTTGIGTTAEPWTGRAHEQEIHAEV
jgi:hypothetical protein